MNPITAQVIATPVPPYRAGRPVAGLMPVIRPGQPLAGRTEEVVAAVVGDLVEGRHVGRALEHGRQRLPGVGRDVDDRLTGVEALHEQQVDPVVLILGLLLRAGDVDAKHTVTGVRVMYDVEGAVAGRDDL